MLREELGDTELVFWERKAKCQGYRCSCWIRATITKRISVMVPTAVVLPADMKTQEDCCVHPKDAYVGALAEQL